MNRNRGVRSCTPPKGYNFIYNQIHNKQTAPKTVLIKWFQKFDKNNIMAVLQLFQYFISSSGCGGKLYLRMMKFKNSTIIKRMGKQFGKNYDGYPIIKKGPLGRRFSKNFSKFTKSFVKEFFKSSFVFDQQICKIIHKIINFLIDFANSHYRPFRHTGTIAVLNMMSVLTDLLLYTRDEEQINNGLIGQIWQKLFKQVFLRRYRDTCSDIRTTTLDELAIWVEKYPTYFFKDHYMKYLGWGLFDEVGRVRLKCISILKPLYTEENKDALEAFTKRFKDRIVNMANDKSDLVACNAIKFMSTIHKVYNNVFNDEDLYIVFDLLYCKKQKIAQAAGEFFYNLKPSTSNENS